MVQVRNHKWDKNDSILTVYFVRFGVERIPVKDDKEFAEWIIGSSLASLSMQSANVRFVMGYEEGVLTDFSADQQWAVEKYGDMDRSELEVIVNQIIEDRDVVQNKKDAETKLKLKNKKILSKKRKSDSQLELELELRRRGFDPSKMKSLRKT